MVICCVCSDFLSDPTCLPNCHHIMCIECARRWAESTPNPRCPLCRTAFSVASLAVMVELKTKIDAYKEVRDVSSIVVIEPEHIIDGMWNGQPVFCKVMPMATELCGATRELEVARAVPHRYVSRVLGVVEDLTQENITLVLERGGMGSLAQRLRDIYPKPLPEVEFVALGVSLCSALHAVNRRNLYHGALTTENVSVFNEKIYKIWDFYVGEGTVDICALGCVLCEALRLDVKASRLRGFPDWLPHAVKRFLRACLDADPEKRPSLWDGVVLFVNFSNEGQMATPLEGSVGVRGWDDDHGGSYTKLCGVLTQHSLKIAMRGSATGTPPPPKPVEFLPAAERKVFSSSNSKPPKGGGVWAMRCKMPFVRPSCDGSDAEGCCLAHDYQRVIRRLTDRKNPHGMAFVLGVLSSSWSHSEIAEGCLAVFLWLSDAMLRHLCPDPFAKVLQSFLCQCIPPASQCITYRGVDVVVTETSACKTGQRFCWPLFSITSRRRDVAMSFSKWRGGTLFSLSVECGRDVSELTLEPSEEQLLLLPAGTCFQVGMRVAFEGLAVCVAAELAMPGGPLECEKALNWSLESTRRAGYIFGHVRKTYVTPRYSNMEKKRETHWKPLELDDLWEGSRLTVLVGEPGMGKTATMLRLWLEIVDKGLDFTPLFVRLPQFLGKMTLQEHLVLHLALPDGCAPLLLTQKLVVFMDCLDEIGNVVALNLRQSLRLDDWGPNAFFVVACREHCHKTCMCGSEPFQTWFLQPPDSEGLAKLVRCVADVHGAAPEEIAKIQTDVAGIAVCRRNPLLATLATEALLCDPRCRVDVWSLFTTSLRLHYQTTQLLPLALVDMAEEFGVLLAVHCFWKGCDDIGMYRDGGHVWITELSVSLGLCCAIGELNNDPALYRTLFDMQPLRVTEDGTRWEFRHRVLKEHLVAAGLLRIAVRVRHTPLPLPFSRIPRTNPALIEHCDACLAVSGDTMRLKLCERLSGPTASLAATLLVRQRRTALSHMRLQGADLSYSALDGAVIFDADLSDADLTGSSLESVEIFGQTSLKNAKLLGISGTVEVHKKHSSRVTSVGWLPDGRVVSGSWDGDVRVSGEVVLRADTTSSPVRWVACKGPLLAVGSHHGVTLYNNLNYVSCFRHLALTSCGCFGHGDTFITGYFDGTVRVGNNPTVMHESPNTEDTAVRAVAYGGNTIATAGRGCVHIWNATTMTINTTVSRCGHGVAVSPDGASVMTTASSDNAIEVWGADDSCRLATDSSQSFLTVSPDGSLMGSIASDGTLTVWDTSTFTVLNVHRAPTDCGSVYSMAFSPDNKRVASGSFDGAVRVWDALSDFSPPPPSNIVVPAMCSVVFSPTGTIAMRSDVDGSVYLKHPTGWDSPMTRLQSPSGGGAIYSACNVCFSSDGAYLASPSVSDDGGCITIFDIAGKCVYKTLPSIKGTVTCLAWHGRCLAVGSTSGHTHIFDDCFSLIKSAAHVTTVRCIDLTDTHYLSGASDGTLQFGGIFSPASEEPLSIPASRHPITCVSFHPLGGQSFAVGGHGMLSVYDIIDEKVCVVIKWSVAPPDACLAVTFTPDGTRLASAGVDCAVRVWDPMTGKETMCLSGLSAPVRSIAFASDGGRMVSSTSDAKLHIWDTSSFSKRITVEGHTGEVVSVIFSGDGKWIVSCSVDGTACVWDTKSCALLATLQHGSPVRCAACLAVDRFIVTGCDDFLVRLWNGITFEEVGSMVGHTAKVRCLGLSHDNVRLVTGSDDKMVRIYDLQTMNLVVTLKGHLGPVTAVHFTPDSRRLVTGSQDTTMKVWDTKRYAEIRTMRNHDFQVMYISFTHAGDKILTGDIKGCCKTFDAMTLDELENEPPHKMWVGLVTSAVSNSGTSMAECAGPGGMSVVIVSRAKKEGFGLLWASGPLRELRVSGTVDVTKAVVEKPFFLH